MRLDMEINAQMLAGYVDLVRSAKPLIHHITNQVTINDCANATLALGASPIMADDPEEAAGIAAVSSALVLNIGTPSARTIQSMLCAGKAAAKRNIPVVFDPVGAGASDLRNRATRKLLKKSRCSVVRGNMSELRHIAGEGSGTKGVDASDIDIAAADQASAIAAAVAATHKTVAAITGATDIVSDGTRTLRIENGHPSMRFVTGTGCMCSSLIGAFCGAGIPAFEAALCGIVVMGIAGELAFERVGTVGTGALRIAIIDEISKMSARVFKEKARIS